MLLIDACPRFSGMEERDEEFGDMIREVLGEGTGRVVNAHGVAEISG
jgi:hypothetical protein